MSVTSYFGPNQVVAGTMHDIIVSVVDSSNGPSMNVSGVRLVSQPSSLQMIYVGNSLNGSIGFSNISFLKIGQTVVLQISPQRSHVDSICRFNLRRDTFYEFVRKV